MSMKEDSKDKTNHTKREKPAITKKKGKITKSIIQENIKE